jgi:uncharacterized protein YjbJ (UPF0337 family)
MSEQEPEAMEKTKGLAKEAVGAVIRSDEMKEKGRAERGKEPAREHQEYFRKVVENTNKRAAGKPRAS